MRAKFLNSSRVKGEGCALSSPAYKSKGVVIVDIDCVLVVGSC